MFSQEIADKICERVANGEPLRKICREYGMPSKSVFYRWLESDPELEGRFARARKEGYDAIAEESLEIADDATNDYMQRVTQAGETVPVFDAEHVQRSKLRIETRLKLLAKWDPKRYGEKLALGGADDLPPLKGLGDTELMARIKALQDKIDGIKG